MLRNYIELLRVKQWIKNLFVVAPLFFSGRFADCDALLAVALAFVAFCLMSSAIYCMNDVADYRNDAKHEKKRHRPVASGKISRTSAIITATGETGTSVCGPTTLQDSPTGSASSSQSSSSVAAQWLSAVERIPNKKCR